MGYFNVTDPPVNAIDGQDIAFTKSINMNDWQMNLTKTLQKADPNGNITSTEMVESPPSSMHGNNHDEMKEKEMKKPSQQEREQESSLSNTTSSNDNNSIQVSIVKGATTLGDKSFVPNPITIKVGDTITWTNNDNTIHTVTSGIPNTPTVGQIFDSGLTSLISPSKTFSHKFINAGEFSYFCRLHPMMVGTINVIP